MDAVADAVYALNAIVGSSAAITNIYTADYTNNEIDLDTNTDFTNPKSFAFVSYEQTTSQGMYQFWAAIDAIDVANYRNDVTVVSILFDETAGFVKQEDGDTSRWFRTDGARPFKDPTTGSAGISMNWKNPVYAFDAGGGGFTSADRADTQATKASTDSILVDTGTTLPASIAVIDSNVDAVKVKTDDLTFTKANELDSNIQSVDGTTITGSGTELDPWGP